ncbi:hypothetical protein RSAG8_12184, partial [Rhizoctonia solani AG-8 WAC10335]
MLTHPGCPGTNAPR